MSRLFSTKRPNRNGYAVIDAHLQAVVERAVKVANRSCREVCGLLISDGYFLRLVCVPNKAKGPLSFEMSLRRARKIKKAARLVNLRLVGAFHSHPISGSEPGDSDIENAQRGMLMLIIDCENQKTALWRIKKRKAVAVSLHVIKPSN